VPRRVFAPQRGLLNIGPVFLLWLPAIVSVLTVFIGSLFLLGNRIRGPRALMGAPRDIAHDSLGAGVVGTGAEQLLSWEPTEWAPLEI